MLIIRRSIPHLEHCHICFFRECGQLFHTFDALRQHFEVHLANDLRGRLLNNDASSYLLPPPTGLVNGCNTAATLSHAYQHHDTTSAQTGLTVPPNGPIRTVATMIDLSPIPAQGPDGRFTCTVCNQDFSRRGDMERHARKHRLDSWLHCPVQGCSYGGNSRKDKVNQHIRNRHPGVARI